VVDRHNVGYRIRWASPDGPMVFQQHASYDIDGAGQITRWHLVCSGDKPVRRWMAPVVRNHHGPAGRFW
jgi:hypothetical protein